jgi:hypothetical protein
MGKVSQKALREDIAAKVRAESGAGGAPPRGA